MCSIELRGPAVLWNANDFIRNQDLAWDPTTKRRPREKSKIYRPGHNEDFMQDL
jgi:hypothetical protein